MLRHNKKRNVGLLNEFFSRYIAKAIIEKRDNDIEKAKSLFCKYFKKGTELNTELKLFNSLYQTKLTNKETAFVLVNRIKELVKLTNKEKLYLEKTALIKEVNSKLNDASFFDQEISDFKICATIQILLNDWQQNSLTENISEIVGLEEKLFEFITTPKQKDKTNEILGMTNMEMDQFVLNIMFEKMDEKFGKSFTNEQKEILNTYVLADRSEYKEKLKKILENITSRMSNLITNEIKENSCGEFTSKKLNEIKILLEENNKNIENPEDDTISFYLTVLKLEKELINASS